MMPTADTRRRTSERRKGRRKPPRWGEMKKFLDWLVFLLTSKGEIGKTAVDLGLCDFSGQGRNKYGN